MLDTIEVSCKTKHNIRLLAHFLYDTAFTLKSSSGGVGAGPGTRFSDVARSDDLIRNESTHLAIVLSQINLISASFKAYVSTDSKFKQNFKL